MATYVSIVLFPILLSFFFSTLSGQKAVNFLPLSFILGILWTFCFGLYDLLDFGAKLMLPVLLILLLVLVIFKYNLVKRSIREEIKSPSLYVFIGLTAWTFVNSRNMKLYSWDEFSAWGPLVKSMFLFDKLGPYSPADLPFAQYISGISMLPYLAMKIEGEWNEALIYWSYQVLIIAILVSIFPTLKWRLFGRNVMVIIASLLSATFFYNSFQTVYVDPILGLLFGLGVVIAASKDLVRDKWSQLNFVALVTLISITKEIGIYFSLTLILLMSVKIFIDATRGKKPFRIKLLHYLILAMTSLVPIVAIQAGWRMAISDQQPSGGRSALGIVRSLLLSGDEGGISDFWNDVVFSNFLTKTFTSPLTSINWFPITTAAWFAVFSFLLVLVIVTAKQKEDRWQNALVFSILSVCFIGYLVMLLLLYMTVFTTGEAIALASYERYVPTYFAGIVLYLNHHFIKDIYAHESANTLSIFPATWIATLLLLSSSIPLMSYVSDPNYASTQAISSFEDERKLINNMDLQVDDDVWIIAQHTVGFEFYFYNYELLPASVGRSPWSIGSTYGEGDIWTDASYTQEKWASKLIDYEYVFVHNVTESFINEFGEMFDDPKSLEVPGFYRVVRDLNRIKLLRVYS